MHSNRNLIFDSSFKDPIIYDEITISTTSISDYGDCYEQVGQSYVFGLKRMGRPVCYRCVTPILRSANILQLAHQQGASPEPASCFVDGRFSLDYILKGANLKCDLGSGSEVDNCSSSNALAVKFRNCTFPDFEMYLKCIGSFLGPNKERYIIVENEESEEYRCGLLVTSSTQELTVHFSNDSSCALLSSTTSFETYRLKPVQTEQISSPCQFPNWVRGDYDSLTVTADWLQYAQLGEGMVAVISMRALVNPLDTTAYGLLRVAKVSSSSRPLLPEKMRTLVLVVEVSDRDRKGGLRCGYGAWCAHSTKMDIVNHHCFRHYATPADLRADDCYKVDIGCNDRSAMKITATHCSTGTVFDSRQYQCIASWKDDDLLYLYTVRDQDTRSCFVAQYSSGRLYISSIGTHCTRGFNFAENAEKTIVLEEEASCSSAPKPKAARRPITSAVKSVNIVIVDPVPDRASTPIVKENPTSTVDTNDPQLTSDPMVSTVPGSLHFVISVISCCLFVILF
ncbi:hypothetical protein OESDEN_08708 [Oesophagostomum dentatum]|uniref:Uncharacterized protein n=1 Tax=Oesophagostomum dentatum TaxID=61180 RepID=A0A0B1T7R2_OESDE|nr:hypothetical protein OESDEN_08708 [Oesophagostomum dentatum]